MPNLIAHSCFFGAPKFKPKIMRISSLIKLTLGEKCAHASFPVTCLNLDETAAEKWVALTRRIAETERRKPRANDKHLVRHLYDLYHLKKHNYLSGQYKKIIAKIMQRDGDIFKKRNT
ncbi:MAG: nucleotidyl transferase AbiEii/AbiGii toxin family protein, partial [Gammaproteobacteria bacterium]|nr:nucleotidyl transferase AbiEii/AbiGii toxin family protein [Gammaproteobacteria bacterium]